MRLTKNSLNVSIEWVYGVVEIVQLGAIRKFVAAGHPQRLMEFRYVLPEQKTLYGLFRLET